MFLPSVVKIFLSSQPTDMRKSHHSLSSLVRQRFPEPLVSGHLFVFYNKKKTLLKVLFYDAGGLALFFKRLERGRFCLPEVNAEGSPPVLSSADLQMILAGLDPRQVKRQKLWAPGSKVNS